MLYSHAKTTCDENCMNMSLMKCERHLDIHEALYIDILNMRPEYVHTVWLQKECLFSTYNFHDAYYTNG